MCEVENSDSVGDERIEAATEIRQGHRGHVNCVLRCVTAMTEENSWSRNWEVYTDSDWASDQTKRKSTSGAVIMAEGMGLHAHSGGQASVALSSYEAEVMAASEGIKEALLLQEVTMFGGLGHYELKSRWTVVRHTHSSIDEVLDA